MAEGGREKPTAEMCKKIVSLASSVLTPTEWGLWLRSSLYGAVAKDDLPAVLELLEAGARDTSTFGNRPARRQSLIYEAAERGNADIVKALLRSRVVHDVNVSSAGFGQTSLHNAVCNGNTAVARVLLRAGAKVEEGGPHGLTPLHFACVTGHHELATDLLMNGAKVDKRGEDGRTPLNVAIMCGHVEVTRVLMRACAGPNARVIHGNTTVSALELATIKGNVDIVKQFLTDGADIRTRCYSGETVLHLAVRGHNIEVMRALIRAGAEVSVGDDNGNTPLHLAAAAGGAEEVNVLVDAGADVDSCDFTGKTPLFRACRGLNPVTVKALLQRGADREATCENGSSPHEETCRRRGRIQTRARILALLASAPALRGWHYRGWLVMLRVRRLAGASENGSRRQRKRGGGKRCSARGVALARSRGQHHNLEQRLQPFFDVVSRLLGVEEVGVFKTVLGFL